MAASHEHATPTLPYFKAARRRRSPGWSSEDLEKKDGAAAPPVLFLCMRWCVRTFVRACVRACLRVCVSARAGAYDEYNFACLTSLYFFSMRVSSIWVTKYEEEEQWRRRQLYLCSARW